MLTEGRVRAIAAQVALAIAKKIKPSVSEEASRDEYVLCETIPEDADTSKKYVPSDGYIYVYEQRQAEVTHNANDGTCTENARPAANSSITTEPVTSDSGGAGTTGNLITAPIQLDKTQSNHKINLSGLDKLYTNYYTPCYVFYYTADGGWLGYANVRDLNVSPSIVDGTLTLPASFDVSRDVSKFASATQIRLMIGVKLNTKIYPADYASLVINCAWLDGPKMVWGWYSTGIQYSNDQATQQNSADISALKERMTSAEEDVAGLLESVTEINTNSVLYAVGDSITYGSGADGYGTINAGWVKHVVARCGYDKAKSKNLGVSGTGFVQVSPGSNGVKIRDVVDANSFVPADDVIVAAGINDWKDWQITLADFWAEMKYCLTKIRTDNPYCRIFYVLPYNCKASGWTGCTYDTHWALGYKGGGSAETCFGYTLKDFRKLILDKFETDEDFKALGVHVISIMPITRGNIDQITGDGLHPNAEGYKIIGSLLSQIVATT